MTTMHPLWIAAVLCGLLAAPPTEARPRKDVHLLLDNSGSMKGYCGTSCKACKTASECPRGMICGRNKRGALRCKEPTPSCRDIWKATIGQAQRYIRTLREGTGIHVYTFAGKGSRMRAVKLPSNVIAQSNRELIAAELDGLKADQGCTHLYDIVSEVLDGLERTPVAPGTVQMLWVFTDGEDDGSKLSGAALRKRLKGLLGKIDGFAWQIVRPGDKLGPLCDGNPRCSNQPKQPNWTVTPTLELTKGESGPLSLVSRQASGTVTLTLDEPGLFPFELKVSFVPEADPKAGAARAALYEYVGPTTLSSTNTEAQVSWQLLPNLAVPRPSRIAGELTLEVLDGEVTLKQTRLAVDIAVKRKSFKKKMAAPRPYSNPEGTRVTLEAPKAVWNAVQVEGRKSLVWAAPKVRVQKSKRLGKVTAVADSSKFQERRIALTLTGPEVTGPYTRGRLSLDMADKNGWLRFGPIRITVRIPGAPPPPPLSCGPGEHAVDTDFDDVPDECRAETRTTLWPLGVVLGLFLLTGLLLWLRRHPDVAPIALITVSRTGVRSAPMSILDNRTARLGRPTGSIALKLIANSDELRDTRRTALIAAEAPAESGEDESEAPEDVLEDLPEAGDDDTSAPPEPTPLLELVVTTRLEKDGSIVLVAPLPVFVGADDPPPGPTSGGGGPKRHKRFVVGRLRGRHLTEATALRVLDHGPRVEVIDLRDEDATE